MKRDRKENIKLLALALILLLGIGFAAIATQLKIEGTLDVAKTSWNVHLENVNITPGSVTANPAPTTDDENKNTTEIAYSMSFNKPGDFYEFTVDMVNSGTIDAMVDSVSNLLYENNGTTLKTLPAYLDSKVTYADGITIEQNHYLKVNTTEKIKVRVEFKKDISISDLPSSSSDTMKFIFKADYKQADEYAEDRPLPPEWTLPAGKTATTLSVGDEICLIDDPTQCFNFIKYDGTNNEDVVMLSKYNLKVGEIYDSSWNKTGEYTSADTGYGKQSSDAKGYISGASSFNGTAAFSATNYWSNGSSLKPEYGTNGTSSPADVYDPVNYKTEPDFSTTCDSTHCFKTPGYSVAYYVENYKTILTGYGATIKEARLLKYSEATDSSIGCSGSSCPTTGDSAFITNTSFWLGSAYINGYVWNVYPDGFFDNDTFRGNAVGVRPVIVISKSDL